MSRSHPTTPTWDDRFPSDRNWPGDPAPAVHEPGFIKATLDQRIADLEAKVKRQAATIRSLRHDLQVERDANP